MYIRLDFDKYKDYVSFEKKFAFDSEYIITRIKKNISDNERIFPRVRLTNKDGKNKSLYSFMNNDEILFAINGGIFNTGTGEAECVLVSNNIVYKDQLETYVHTRIEDGGEKRNELYILGITRNGDFKFYDPSFTSEEIIKDGCMDAIMGFVPLIENFKELNLDERCSYISMDKNPRQVVGQMENDDFVIVTVLKPGMTLEEVRKILEMHHVKNAYNLDGGSSTQAVYHYDAIMPFYRGDTGREIPSVITFEVITGDLVI